MSHFGVKTHGHGSARHTETDFPLVSWTILSSLIFALVVFFFVIL